MTTPESSWGVDAVVDDLYDFRDLEGWAHSPGVTNGGPCPTYSRTVVEPGRNQVVPELLLLITITQSLGCASTTMKPNSCDFTEKSSRGLQTKPRVS